MHLKRSRIPKTWPIKRKGTKYVVRPLSNIKNSLPLLIVLRDILGLAKDRKEVKKLIHLKKIKVNNKFVKDEKFAVTLFDVISLNGKDLRLILKNKKFSLEEAKDKEKIVKVIGKKILKKGKVQINLGDGRNYLFNEKIKVGDSVILDLEKNKISKILPMKKDSKIIFISGKRLGEEGTIEDILQEKGIIKVKTKDGVLNAKKENVMVVK